MDWRRDDLRILETVAQTGSFTATAVALQYTQSGISKRIAAMEAAIGVPLVVRRTRGVELTAAGAIVRGHGREVLERMAVLDGDLEAIRMGTGGRLRLGSFPAANASLTPSALLRLQAGRPDVTITLDEALSPELLQRVAAGDLDCAVVSDYPRGRIRGDRVTLVHVLDDPLLVALPKRHRLASAKVVALVDLAGEKWIAAGHDDTTVLAIAAAAAGFDPLVDIRVASWTAKQNLVASGLGVTLVPRLIAGTHPRGLVLRDQRQIRARKIFAALPQKGVTTAARAFVDELKAEAGQLRH
jgi:DNA-binding transcriptional LysR family regulator